VLRYWETEFPALSEGKDKGSAKLYTARDVRIIARIRELLYDEGFTVAGAKKRLEAEIVEGRFDEGLAAAPPAREPRRSPTPASRAGDLPLLLKVAPQAKAAIREEEPSSDFDLKSVVRELREIVKLLGPGRKK
jgi:DNA-binding transcriptional MerR regulator